MSLLRRLCGPMGLAILASCSFAPRYTRPSAEAPQAYRELTPADYAGTDGWKQAQPSDELLRGSWWEIFGDPPLNELEQEVDVSNQTLALAAAHYREARALVAEARSQLFPTVTSSPSARRSRPGGNQFQLPVDASWEPDLWGRVRNSVAANADEAQATAADLESTRLSLHAELAVDYSQLRAQDAQKQLLDDTVVAYRKALELTKIRHEGGVATDEDVAQAETQLQTTTAQDTDVGVARAQLEHAIAVLVGKPASSFSIPAAPLTANPPAIPLGVPSQLLERRPDIAAAERRVAEANAQLGVAKAAFFPTLTLSGDAGFASNALGTLFSLPSRVWALGASLATILFDGGQRQAQVEQAMASYAGLVASYRQTALTAFQEVEDELAAVRILSQERQQQDDAVAASERFLALAEDRYRFGVDPYLNVITAQTTLLVNRRTAVTIRMEQMTASAQLVKALGGGWEASQLPSPAAEARGAEARRSR
jgi:NodT family efflux transporter outer membrane factor (OMF) lipoprotein